MNDQAGALRDYIRRKNLSHLLTVRKNADSDSGVVITLSSGKGGVGKTTLALNLALASDRNGLVVDGDFMLGNLATMINEGPRRTWEEILRSPEIWKKAVVRLDDTTAVLAPAPAEDERQFRAVLTTDRVVRLLRDWQAGYDFIIIDTASGLATQVIEWCLAAQKLMVMVTPEPAACTDAYALIKSISLTGKAPEIGILVNQYLPSDEAETVFRQLNMMSERFLERSLEFYGAIPRSDEIARSIRLQKPAMLAEPSDGLSSVLQEVNTRLHEFDYVNHEPLSAMG